MKKILLALFSISILAYSQSIEKISVTGLTQYLTNDEVEQIRELFSKNTKADELDLIEQILNKRFKDKYRVNLIYDGDKLEVHVSPLIGNVNYAVSSNVNIPSIKTGSSINDVDDRELALLELNPNVDVKVVYNINKEGKVNVDIIEETKKMNNHKVYVDATKNKKKKADVRYGYQYSNYNIGEKGGILKVKTEVKDGNNLTLKGSYSSSNFEKLSQLTLFGSYDRYGEKTKNIKFSTDSYEIGVKNKKIVTNTFNYTYGLRYEHYINSLKLGEIKLNTTVKELVPFVEVNKIKKWDKSLLDAGLKLEATKIKEKHYKVKGNLDFITLLSKNLTFGNKLSLVKVYDKSPLQMKEPFKNISSRADEYFGMETALEYGKDNRIGIFNRYEIGRQKKYKVRVKSNAIGLTLNSKVKDLFDVKLNAQTDLYNKNKNYKLGFRLEKQF